MTTHYALAPWLIFLIATSCLGQEAADVQVDFDSEEAKAARLEYVMGHANGLKGKFKQSSVEIVPLDAPLLRWTNPYSNVKDGFLVGWKDSSGRPVAMGQIYLLPNQEAQWGIELQSLSQKAFSLASKTNGPWRPRNPGVEWSPVPDNSIVVPNSKPLRLAQMRKIARRFRVDDDFDEKESELRLLTKPLMRYQIPDDNVADGAVFAFVHGTDPELIVCLELRTSSKAKSYHYALAPMTSYALRCKFDGQEVWDKPRMTSNRDTDVFWQRNVSDVPVGGFLRLLGF